MASTIARAGSVALTELQSDLTQLSITLYDIYELMNADMRGVNDYWQDGKYKEFIQSYQPQIQKCEEIATRYAKWCSDVLQPTIDNVIAVETTDVGSGDSAVGVVAGGTAVVGGAGFVGGFNMNGKTTRIPQAVSISNGCGSENSWVSRNGAKFIGRPVDALIAGTSIKDQDASCDQHDLDYHFGVDKETADNDFKQRSRFMGGAVKWAETKSYESYMQAQKDRQISQQLQSEHLSQWEESHQQSFDAAHNYFKPDIMDVIENSK